MLEASERWSARMSGMPRRRNVTLLLLLLIRCLGYALVALVSQLLGTQVVHPRQVEPVFGVRPGENHTPG